MTECLPVTDGERGPAAGRLGGVGVGRAVPGCEVRIASLLDDHADIADGAGWGEILVRAPWMFDGYDAAWGADAASLVVRESQRFHRTGDVGYLENGTLFYLGRRGHVLETAAGPLASVALEMPVAAVLGREVAAVGVGPAGGQVVCLIVEGEGELCVAEAPLREAARAACPSQVAAVLVGSLPTDRRHESKVDRTALRLAAERFLAGR